MPFPATFKNPNMGMGNPEDYKWRGDGVPTRENCNLNSPREMFLWMWTGAPGMNGGQIMLPPEYFMIFSEHQCELGAMLKCEACGHEKKPVKKYRPPTSSDPHWATSPGQWVPIDTPDPPVNPAKAVVAKLSPVQKAELRQILNAEHEGEPE